MLALGACSDDGSADPSSDSGGSAPDGPASTGEVGPSGDDAAVLEAYSQSWQLYDDFVNGEARGDPADHFDGDLLDTLNDRIAEFAEGGYELRGEADISPSEVSVDGRVARLTDCQVDRTFAVVADTGEVVVPAGVRPQLVDVRLVKVDGRWKVASAVYGPEGSCVR